MEDPIEHFVGYFRSSWRVIVDPSPVLIDMCDIGVNAEFSVNPEVWSLTWTDPGGSRARRYLTVRGR